MGDTQAKTRTRLGGALLKTHETLDRAAAFRLGNAGSAIRNNEQHTIAFLPHRQHDFGRRFFHGSPAAIRRTLPLALPK